MYIQEQEKLVKSCFYVDYQNKSVEPIHNVFRAHFLGLSSRFSPFWRFLMSEHPGARSSLNFSRSTLFTFSLGFSVSPSSALSGFFRSYETKTYKMWVLIWNSELQTLRHQRASRIRLHSSFMHPVTGPWKHKQYLDLGLFLRLFLVLFRGSVSFFWFFHILPLPSVLLSPLASFFIPQALSLQLPPSPLFFLLLPNSLD